MSGIKESNNSITNKENISVSSIISILKKKSAIKKTTLKKIPANEVDYQPLRKAVKNDVTKHKKFSKLNPYGSIVGNIVHARISKDNIPASMVGADTIEDSPYESLLSAGNPLSFIKIMGHGLSDVFKSKILIIFALILAFVGYITPSIITITFSLEGDYISLLDIISIQLTASNLLDIPSLFFEKWISKLFYASAYLMTLFITINFHHEIRVMLSKEKSFLSGVFNLIKLVVLYITIFFSALLYIFYIYHTHSLFWIVSDNQLKSVLWNIIIIFSTYVLPLLIITFVLFRFGKILGTTKKNIINKKVEAAMESYSQFKEDYDIKYLLPELKFEINFSELFPKLADTHPSLKKYKITGSIDFISNISEIDKLTGKKTIVCGDWKTNRPSNDKIYQFSESNGGRVYFTSYMLQLMIYQRVLEFKLNNINTVTKNTISTKFFNKYNLDNSSLFTINKRKDYVKDKMGNLAFARSKKNLMLVFLGGRKEYYGVVYHQYDSNLMKKLILKALI